MVDPKRKRRSDISIWVAASAVAVLGTVVVAMLLTQFQQRRDQAIWLFIEKGATLIQTFEAGLYDPMIGADAMFHLQRRLMETAEQPDIDYIIVTDHEGVILADSDPSMLGMPYGLDLASGESGKGWVVQWRQTANPEGADTFEVYRSFQPRRPAALQNGESPWIIYVGFNMGKIDLASRQDTIRTVAIALMLALVGSLAIISLFLVQTYRLTRSSLSRVTAFSYSLVKHLPIALLAVDSAGRIAALNARGQGLLISNDPDAIGKEARTCLPSALNRFLDGVTETTSVLGQDLVLRTQAGEETTWELLGAVLETEEDSAGKIILARDVTALRQMEVEITRGRHFAAIGSLAAGVAHEVRNPLSSIKGFAVYFKKRLMGHPEDEEAADIMIAETERLNRVITQLIDFARPARLNRQKVDIADLVRHGLRLIEVEARDKGVDIQIASISDQPPIWVDVDSVKQVLLNIFINALAAMPDGGRLTVDASVGGRYLELTVRDTGQGIDPSDLPRIFDPYFTSKPSGTGLGLAIAQKIMNAHGGQVVVDSQKGSGTTVRLRFPVNDE